jgi:SAM-dependent methyltransferase
MTKDKKAYEGWDTDSHLQTFDVWNRQANFAFNFAYGCFAEQRYLRSTLLNTPAPRVLDVGCATGTTYRYISNMLGSREFEYLGVDLSQPAIDRAKGLYPQGDFRKKDHERIIEYTGSTYDIVFSRDTILHQTHPYEFLQELLDATERVLIVRLRTRDQGATVLDVEQSCQMHYDQYWMPYIVLNTDELVSFLKASPRVSKITLNRSYEVLGGQNFRYLPKDLYVEAAGGAETSLMIELSTGDNSSEAEIIYEDFLEGHAFLRKNRLKRYAFGFMSKVMNKIGRRSL